MEEVGRADLGDLGRMLLHAPIHDLCPGEVVHGILQLNLMQEPLLVRGAWVKLTGKNILKKED